MRSVPAARSRRGKQSPDRHYRPRRERASALAALAGITFAAAACGSGPASSSPVTAGGATSGTGAVTRSGSGSQSGNDTSGGYSTTGGYTLAFAECMRAHGVPKFPDPNGSPGQLGPGSGIDLTSPAYQAALHGPCESLAPAGQVSSGPVTQGGGS